MIEVKLSSDQYSVCQSCGDKANLVDLRIRRNMHVNAVSFCLCEECVKKLWEQTEMTVSTSK